MPCTVCHSKDTDLRMGVCFDCATDGDIRLAKKSTIEHWLHSIKALSQGAWWIAKLDFKIGWQRIWRTGEYAIGREWENY